MNKKALARIVLIIAFVVLAVWGLRQAEAAEVRIGLSQGFLQTEGKALDAALYVSDWYIQAARIGGEGELPDQFVRYSAGFRVDWREGTEFSPYLRFGAAYFTDEPCGAISDRWAYDMAAGLRLLQVLELEWQHNSTAGRTPVNSGLDYVSLNFVKEF